MTSLTRFWRTLDEAADDPAFHEQLINEFPSQIETVSDPIARRRFLKLMGASLALGGFTACTRQPAETIVPYVRPPDGLTVGNHRISPAMTIERRLLVCSSRHEDADKDRRKSAIPAAWRVGRLRAGRYPRLSTLIARRR
jgi:MoCo/4Fe-4S cofactor protein with predicted Tat translocation signal